MARSRVAFLFLGETLLIPHLFPVVEALAVLDPALPIDLWVGTATHETLLGRWSAPLPSVSIRRAPFFVAQVGQAAGDKPRLPPKIPTLIALAPRLSGTRVAVCAELTSLWLPVMFPLTRTRFVKTAHGAGSVQRRRGLRRWATWRTLVPSERERAHYLTMGYRPDQVVATGYVKSAFRQRTGREGLFRDARPILVYAPHWQPHRSSWWKWGRAIVAMLAAQDRYNVILAPHQRLPEGDGDARAFLLATAADSPHIHVDLDSFSTVDGSYMAAADLYLGDTSSQVVEFMVSPRPCVFLDAQGTDWRTRADRDFWHCGEVVASLDRLPEALAEAPARHADYRALQMAFVAEALGAVGLSAPIRAAATILETIVTTERSPIDRDFRDLLGKIS